MINYTFIYLFVACKASILIILLMTLQGQQRKSYLPHGQIRK